MKINDYDGKVNYIGNADWQYKYTDKFYRSISGINYTAYWHDILYGQLMQREQGFVAKLLLKVLLDLVFLVMGFFRCLRNLQLHGCVFTIILYVILLVSTPYVMYKIIKTG